METLWIFREFNSGGMAIFKTKEEAIAFRRKVDISLLLDPEIGEALADDEYSIDEVQLNPDFDKWIIE